MSLIGDVKKLCDRLAPLGWRDLLLDVTNNALDISQPTTAKLATALNKRLRVIDRSKMGFEDFHPNGNRGITGGRPSQSLLFHALASPNVHQTPSGSPSSRPTAYATLEELDQLENYIYGLVANRTDLSDTVIAVFAYQYRVASRTSHQRYADIAYSRTGVARVGTSKPNYVPSNRSFWVIPKDGGDALSVLPARYGVFLARKTKPGFAGSVQGGHRGPRDDDFIFPVHKLFDGRECLKGQNLTVDFLEFHRNEKLKKAHQLPQSEGGLPVPAGFDITKKPYVRDSNNDRGNLASLQKIGSSRLVIPRPHDTLVRTVSQKNKDSNKEQLVHFIVPKERQITGGRSNRFSESTLEIPAFNGSFRLAPEYVNIRHEINPNGPVNQTPTNLNTLKQTPFENAMKNGGYAAAHFTDDSCDGCIEADVKGLTRTTSSFAAFSLITAPDYFPLADQYEIETDDSIQRVEPLSKGRQPVNIFLPLPSNQNSSAFERTDKTVTSIVGEFASGSRVSIQGHPNKMVSYLPDGASNYFAPGWDVSTSIDRGDPFLTNSGLGSPFPEDAKLCAAIASFWPAVAPDNGRTFGNQGFGNQLPMLDEELGFHPNHQRVKSGEINSYFGWDGEYGPFFEKVNGKTFVNYVAIERSDYVSHALANRIRVSLTADVQSEDLIARNQALEACQSIPGAATSVPNCLVVFREIEDWAGNNPGRRELKGKGFLLEFAELRGGQKPTSELVRVRREVKKRHVFQFGSNGIAYKNGNAAFRFFRH